MFWWFSKTAEFFTGCFQDSLVDKYHGVISLSQDDALQPNVVCQICLTLCNSLAARQSSSGEPERKGCDCGRWIWHLEVVSWGKMNSLLSPLFGCPGAEGAFYYSLRALDILQNLTSPFVVGKFSIYSVLRRELISYWYPFSLLSAEPRSCPLRVSQHMIAGYISSMFLTERPVSSPECRCPQALGWFVVFMWVCPKIGDTWGYQVPKNHMSDGEYDDQPWSATVFFR